MRTLAILLVVLAPLGCAYPTSAESILDIHPDYEAGGGSGGSGDQDPNASVADAAITCKVQGNASFSGTFAGSSFAAKDAIEMFDPTVAKFTFLVTDYAGACAAGGAPRAGSTVVAITYDGNALKAGDYDVASTAGLHATYTRYDATCGVAATETATTGKITFDRLDNCGGTGSFDLTFGADHVTASFTGSICLGGGAPASCQ
ncbi:MAG TPA: hypothetical protein VGH28_34175 [Polyangiaceae bacterium]